jgi:hypothetical protein
MSERVSFNRSTTPRYGFSPNDRIVLPPAALVMRLELLVEGP